MSESGPRFSVATWFLFGAVAAGVVLGVARATSLWGPGAPEFEALEGPMFVEEAQSARLQHAYTGDDFFVGGGVAVFDCDGDFFPDLYLAGGESPAALYRNESEPGGQLRFSRVSDAHLDLPDVTGAYPLDIDGDALVDLVILRKGENRLLRGKGDCRFEDFTTDWSLDADDAWTTAFSAMWEAGESWPTLAFGNYLSDQGDKPDDAVSLCDDNVLVRPAGESGPFAASIALDPGLCALSMLFSDWGRKGQVDLRVSNDRHYYRSGEEQLWRVLPDSPPLLYTKDEGWNRLQIWGMGIASQDVTGDGLPEVFLTSQGDNKLQTLASGTDVPSYHDIALRSGVTAHAPFVGETSLSSTAWHPQFEDVNNDGLFDLYISKGNVQSQEGFAVEDPNNLMLGQPDGKFSEHASAAGILNVGQSRGAAIADLNLDGMLDLIEVNRFEQVRLWRNVGWGDAVRPAQMGRWIAIRIEQAGGNRNAIGSWIEIRVGDRVVVREVTVGGGHAGGHLGWVHFGLGYSRQADVRVIWPDGEEGPWMDISADNFAIIERGLDDATLWAPHG